MVGVIGLVSVGVIANYMVDLSNEMYAKWQMGDRIVEYLREHDNEWPQSWTDLENHFESTEWKDWLVKTKPLIYINFSVSKEWICGNLRAIRSGKHVLVSTRSGDTSHYESGDPNKIICDYFESVCKEKTK
ncbi:MAG TPA: hypothetical protein VLA12_01245 [Planctomycetaceae bacterium]|nr:hypothetical protein [Planctomycetaceae bacterium]